MGKRKSAPPAEPFRVRHYEHSAAVRPLFGLERLVPIQRRKRNGVLFCDSVACAAHRFTFSKSNTRREQFSMGYITSAIGFLGEPRLNAPNEAAASAMDRFYDHGTEFQFAFTPEGGRTYSSECDIYRPLETYNGMLRSYFYEDVQIDSYLMRVDLSAYFAARLFDRHSALRVRSDRAKRARPQRAAMPAAPSGRQRAFARRLAMGAQKRCARNAAGVLGDRRAWRSRGFESLNMEKIATELSVDTRFAKDLHNFVSICQFFAAGFRSLNVIGRKMITNRSFLMRSIESIEQMVGAELIERTKGKGLIRMTPAGEAVLEWWSRFYTRWTPIAPEGTRGR